MTDKKETALDAMSEKDYEIGTLEKCNEFAEERNYDLNSSKQPGYTFRQFLKNIFLGYLRHK